MELSFLKTLRFIISPQDYTFFVKASYAEIVKAFILDSLHLAGEISRQRERERKRERERRKREEGIDRERERER